MKLQAIPKFKKHGSALRRQQNGQTVNSAEEETTKIRSFLVLENRLLRDLLARFLQRREDMEVIGRCDPREASIEVLAASGCQVVLVDFVEPEWLSLVNSQTETVGQSVKVIVVSMDGEWYKFLQAVRGGVAGYVLKDASTSDVVGALHAAVLSEATCPR
jgi:DNA-binding NarL/FixJ family response regulator